MAFAFEGLDVDLNVVGRLREPELGIDARPVLVHRMALSFAARARGESLGAVIDRISGRVTGTMEAAA